MEFELIISFLGAAIVLTLLPGPDNIFVLVESLTKGKKTGVAISIGLCLGVLVHTSLAATGLSIIISESILVFKIIKYFGAGYLFYLMIMTLKEKKILLDIDRINEKSNFNFLKLVRKGFLMNVLNPKVSIFFIAFLPQFISKNGFNIIFQMMILGIIFIVQALIIFIALANLSGKLSKYLKNDSFWTATKWGKAIVLGILGLTLALSKK